MVPGEGFRSTNVREEEKVLRERKKEGEGWEAGFRD
jgi:hypothetical protein